MHATKSIFQNAKWDGPHRGAQLSGDYFGGLLDKNTPGLYLWRKVLRDDDSCIYSPEDFVAWVSSGVGSPLFKTSRLRVESDKADGKLSVRANFLSLQQLEVGGGRLPDEKRINLMELAACPEAASDLYSFFHSATHSFGPILYVGESDDLLSRFRQHLSEDSPLRTRLAELELDVPDTVLFYCKLPGTKKTERQLLESALTHLLVAPLTYRAG